MGITWNPESGACAEAIFVKTYADRLFTFPFIAQTWLTTQRLLISVIYKENAILCPNIPNYALKLIENVRRLLTNIFEVGNAPDKFVLVLFWHRN